MHPKSTPRKNSFQLRPLGRSGRQLILATAILTLMCNFSSSQIQRGFTVRKSYPSLRGDVVFVANNIITSSCVINTEVAPAGGAQNNDGVAKLSCPLKGI